MNYLDTAPASLVARHSNYSKFPGRDLLGKLLTDKSMAIPWTSLSKNLTKEADFNSFLAVIVQALREKYITGEEVADFYKKIHNTSNKLIKLIREQPATNSNAGYKGELDVMVGDIWADTSYIGPSIVEVLEKLASMAECSSIAAPSAQVVKKDKGNVKSAIVARRLHEFLIAKDATFNKYAALAAVINIAAPAAHKFASKSIRTLVAE